ncbi:MAG: STAS domain-containing protein [Zoogloeaceae bacterium]|jgi:phospholipid transport system transporter-binding protein|nr:STAS domain-containing protein [Zoogloeaceae bacterium]
MIRQAADGEAPRLVVDVAAVTLKNAHALWEAGRPFLDGREKTIDLAAVKEVDSAALAMLLEWQRENLALAAEGEGGLRLSGAPANLVTLADLYGLLEVMGLDRIVCHDGQISRR